MLGNQLMSCRTQALMFDAMVKTLGFVSEAVRTSWYGLGCPHCTQAAISCPVLTTLHEGLQNMTVRPLS